MRPENSYVFVWQLYFWIAVCPWYEPPVPGFSISIIDLLRPWCALLRASRSGGVQYTDLRYLESSGYIQVIRSVLGRGLTSLRSFWFQIRFSISGILNRWRANLILIYWSLPVRILNILPTRRELHLLLLMFRSLLSPYSMTSRTQALQHVFMCCLME